MRTPALSTQSGLTLLGVFHVCCLVSMVLGSLYFPFVKNCMSVVIIANGLVAVGVTAPLSGKKVTPGAWRSLGSLAADRLRHHVHSCEILGGDSAYPRR